MWRSLWPRPPNSTFSWPLAIELFVIVIVMVTVTVTVIAEFDYGVNDERQRLLRGDMGLVLPDILSHFYVSKWATIVFSMRKWPNTTPIRSCRCDLSLGLTSAY